MPPEYDEDGNLIEATVPPPTVDWDVDDNPYKGRFEEYRKGADRKATEYAQQAALLADLQSDDPSKQSAAAEALGFQFDAGESYQDPDPFAEMEQRYGAKFAALEQQFAERTQRDEAVALAQAIDSSLEELGVTDKDEGDFVLAMALKLPHLENGLPDLPAALEAIQARDQGLVEKYRGTKRPSPILPGKTGSDAKNVVDMTDDERLDHYLSKHGMD